MNSPPTLRLGAAVLCGGKSSRMGLPKATLPFGPETMLLRVLRLLRQAADPCVVVAAPSQELPPLPPEVVAARDEREGRGPLEGIAAALRAMAGRAEAVYITSCDVPLLSPAFVRRMAERLQDNDIAVPVEGKFHHPLAAVYRISALPVVERLLAEDRLRPVFLYDQAPTARVPVDELREVDPGLRTLANLNYPSDYLAALKEAGFTPAPHVLAALHPAAPG